MSTTLEEKQLSIYLQIEDLLKARDLSESDANEVQFTVSNILQHASNAREVFYYAAFNLFGYASSPKLHELQTELAQIEKDYEDSAYEATRDEFMYDHNSPAIPAFSSAVAELLKAGWSKESIIAELNYSF